MDGDRKEAQIIGSTRQLVADLATLVRHELDEATWELAGKIKAAGVGAGMVGASAFAGMMSIVCLSALVAVLLSEVIPPWAAVLTISVAWVIATLSLVWLGKKKVESAAPFLPERTIEHLKEDFASARERREQPPH